MKKLQGGLPLQGLNTLFLLPDISLLFRQLLLLVLHLLVLFNQVQGQFFHFL